MSSGRGGVAYAARVVTGNLHLLAGMVRANDPWRLALRLQRALTATVAASVFAIVTQEIWSLADHMGAQRLTFVTIGSITAVGATLMIGAEALGAASAGLLGSRCCYSTRQPSPRC